METGPTTTPAQSPLTRYLIAAGVSVVVVVVIIGLACYFCPTPTPSVAPTSLVEQPEVEYTPLPAQPVAKTVYVTRVAPQAAPAPAPAQKVRPTVTSDVWQAAEAEFDTLLGDTK